MTLPRRILQLALWMSAFLAAYPAVAQRVIEMRGFKFSEYYDAPQETKVKVRLQGARARPLSGGLVEVNTAKVETFREDGLAELVVEAPECIHSSTGRVIYSSGPLLVKTADGSFSIRGEGFLYQQTNSTLFISNNVETVATPDLLKQGKENQADSDGPATPMHIRSQAFRYSGDDGAGVYSGQVQVTGTNLAVSSELISLKLPVEERRLHEIIAEDNVLLDYAGMSASGQKAVYNVDTEIAEVTGQPAWRSESREGRADTFIIDRTNRLVLAKGDAWLRMPGQSLAGNLLPNLDNAGVTNQSAGLRAVEIRSANYELRTNNITFQNGVLVTEFEGDRPAGTLSCRQMAVDFSGTNQVERLTASEKVVIERENARFLASDAVYTGTNNVLQLRGSPSWQAGERSGKGDTIDVDASAREMLVKGKASMRLPAEVLHRTTGGMEVQPRQDIRGTNAAYAEIFSEEYRVAPERALFQGGVYITHPRIAWSCETLTVDLPPQGQHIERVIAEQQVSFNLVDNSGQQVHGRGESAIYKYSVSGGKTNEQMHLTGSPVVQTTNGAFRNKVIIYDLAADTVMGPGRYSFKGTAPALNTNTFKLPR